MLPTALPTLIPSLVPSTHPSTSPSLSITPSTAPSFVQTIVFSVDVCWTSCGGLDQDANFNTVQDTLLEYALGGIDSNSISIVVNTEEDDCEPCGESSPQGRRFLQDGTSGLKSSVVFELKAFEAANVTLDDVPVIENLNASIAQLNQDLAAKNVTEISFEGVVEEATKQPTSFPTTTPSETPSQAPEAPSPPPQDLSTRRLAEEINKFYDMSDRHDLREVLEEAFENAHDVEDIITHTKGHQLSRDNKISSPRRSLRDIDSQDYYADLPEFITQDVGDPFKCQCIDCEEDKICGGLWKGDRFPDDLGNSNVEAYKVHIVVSHCKSDLDWLSGFTREYDVESIHIISKCGRPVIGAPESATIEVLPNIGRCDHSYAYYITTVLDQKVAEEDAADAVVVFLKDDISQGNFHQSGSWNDFGSLVRLASSENGFACGIIPGEVDFGLHRFFLSAYHEKETLFDFSMDEYSRNIKGYVTDESNFKSKYDTLGSWYESLGVKVSTPELVQVCYGGVFAAKVGNIRKKDKAIWHAVEKSLSRGNNIQEGHYAERSWASLISTPLLPFQVDALKDKSDGIYLNKNSMHGALLKRPRLYLHVGVEGTKSTELLSESLVANIDKLESDGYNVAVHGKWDDGIYGFPNVDRLGSCMWSDINKSQIPEHLKEAAICPENMLSNLSKYMEASEKNSRDMVILNPWLVRKGTAESLASYFNPGWDVSVVIYYRRYFEWITIVFDDWRQELLDEIISPDKIPSSTLRYIDFLREYCKRLFYGKNVHEDGFPVREMKNEHDNKSAQGKVYFNQFDPTTNFEVEELTDLQEYTYFVAKQYYSQSRFRHGVDIVNYHDIRGPETNFYCHILHDAHNACKDAVDRETSLFGSDHFEMKYQDFPQKNPKLPLKPSQAFEEIAIAAFEAGRLHFDQSLSRKKFTKQILMWMEMIHSALQSKDTPITDLPKECLYQFEIDRLLEVSLAYEKALLPGYFDSPRGAEDLKHQYSKWSFCSVDTSRILNDPKWAFLFERASEYSIPDQPKAYIHIGAPKTGSTSIQDTMAMDKRVLEEDKYYLAMHGQVTRKGKPEEYIIDNMLVQCDRLGACVWSDEQRQMVVEGSGNPNAGRCPDYLRPAFDDFLSKAIDAKSNVVISNEWLNRPTSEEGLLDILDGWDPIVVIYYRRFFDWMISAHYQWHFDLGVESLESSQGKVRLVDFIRMFCGRLFASKAPHSPSDADLSFVDLVDIQEYTYHAWKRYKKVPQYDNNIKIVNFHDGHIIKSFYCDVLNADKACKVETDRLAKGGSVQTRSKSSTTYVDLAIGLYWKDRMLFAASDADIKIGTKPTMETFYALAEIFKTRMAAKGKREDDLPKECLTSSERSLLLNVSLAYEKILLPESYAIEGGLATEKHFEKKLEKGNFCSVDLDEILVDQNWHFLFDNEETGALQGKLAVTI